MSPPPLPSLLKTTQRFPKWGCHSSTGSLNSRDVTKNTLRLVLPTECLQTKQCLVFCVIRTPLGNCLIILTGMRGYLNLTISQRLRGGNIANIPAPVCFSQRWRTETVVQRQLAMCSLTGRSIRQIAASVQSYRTPRYS